MSEVCDSKKLWHGYHFVFDTIKANVNKALATEIFPENLKCRKLFNSENGKRKAYLIRRMIDQ